MPSVSMAVRLPLVFGALFVVYGVNVTYLPVWLDARGLTAAQISLATSLPLFLRLLATPTLGFLADRAQAHRTTILALCSTALALMLALTQASGTLLIVLGVALSIAAVQTVMPLLDAITMSQVRAAGLDYGRVRLWGSLTFVLASYAAGFAAATFGPEAIIRFMIAGAMLTVAAAILLPARAGPHDAEGRARPGLADMLAILKDRRFLLFLACSGAIQASHALFYTFGVLHWRAQGLSAGFIGTLWAAGVAAEIVLFWMARRIAAVGAAELMLLGGLAGVVRWTAMAFDPPAAALVPLQLLHAGTFAAAHLGAMQWIVSSVPAHQAGTAQALLSTFNAGIAFGLATLASGVLFEHFGSGGYLAMAGMCLAGVAAGLALRRS